MGPKKFDNLGVQRDVRNRHHVMKELQVFVMGAGVEQIQIVTVVSIWTHQLVPGAKNN